MHQAQPIATIGSGLTQVTDGQATSGVTTKLFADKENNCGATHLFNGKMSKSGATLRHANTSDNVVVDHRPSSKLGAPEHQMEDASLIEASFSGVAAALQNSH